MSAAPLYLDMDGYGRLSWEMRDQLNAWLTSEGLTDRHVIAIAVGEGFVDIERYATSDNGDLIVHDGEIVLVSERWPVSTPPPAAAFTARATPSGGEDKPSP